MWYLGLAMNEYTYPATPEEFEEYCMMMDMMADEAENSTPDPEPEDFDCDDERDDDEPWDGFRDDVEADADALASAGWGTDEDYGGYDDGGGDW